MGIDEGPVGTVDGNIGELWSDGPDGTGVGVNGFITAIELNIGTHDSWGYTFISAIRTR